MILTLAGGVGGAKLANGFAKVCSPDDLLIGVNIGDDFIHFGLHISPDLDSVMYRLAGLNDQERGWGLADESWNFMRSIARLGGPEWFNLGDHDLATHMERTRLLGLGKTLSEVTVHLSQALGVKHHIAPVSNEKIRTKVKTANGDLSFQDYFVRMRCEPEVRGFTYEGAEHARLLPSIEIAVASSNLQAIVICPSNPFVSIEPILAIPALRELLITRTAPCIAVSPIIEGKAVKGPAAKMMRELGLRSSSYTIARYYKGLIDGLVIDRADENEQGRISKEGIRTLVTGTLMPDSQAEEALARRVLAFSSKLRS